jgi:hypothetical protein
MPRGDLALLESRDVLRTALLAVSPFSSNPPYSPIAATSLQNCTNILDYPAPRRYLVFNVVAVERFRFSIRARRGNSLEEGIITTAY